VGVILRQQGSGESGRKEGVEKYYWHIENPDDEHRIAYVEE